MVVAEPPYLVIRVPENPVIQLDARTLECIYTEDAAVLFLQVYETTVLLRLKYGVEARTIADQLAPYTRWERCLRADMYEYLKQEITVPRSGLVVGGDEVRAQDGMIVIGTLKFRIPEVSAHANAGVTFRFAAAGACRRRWRYSPWRIWNANATRNT